MDQFGFWLGVTGYSWSGVGKGLLKPSESCKAFSSLKTVVTREMNGIIVSLSHSTQISSCFSLLPVILKCFVPLVSFSLRMCTFQ